ncbi:MAG: hypothetical protein Q9170_003599, partial [Blastenia crenularia]
MGNFKRDPTMEIVHEDGRPSYFQEKMTKLHEPIEDEKPASDHQASTHCNGRPAGLVSDTEVDVSKSGEMVKKKPQHRSCTPDSSSLDESEEKKITELARTLSYQGVRNEKGEDLNPFFGSEDPSLDPNSGKFSIKTWLETLMSITSRDPERYPKRVSGVAYKSLSAHGYGEATDYQKTFGNYPLKLLNLAKRLLRKGKKTRIQILRDFDGLVKSGEMLVVLGRPGRQVILSQDRENIADKRSGCSTLLKTLSGETDGFHVADDSYLNYQGIPKEIMHKDFRGECIYQAELDVHFPQLSVGQTLDFAARARAPRNRLPGVGNDFIRGVSGGERKRVSIAEANDWGDSDRDTLSGVTVNIRPAVVYEGRQIYFGDIHAAKSFFVNLGFECPPRQTTADFLTSLTNPAERVVRRGFEGKTPYTPDEFATVWQASEDRARLFREIEEFDNQYPVGGPSLDEFRNSRKSLQARSQRVQSPYTLSVPMQVKLCVRRGYQRLRGDMALLITGIIFNSVMALVVGSVFYNLPNNTGSLYGRGALIFFGILLAAFASALEILTLYAQRPIVEKQSKYMHPWFRWINYLNPVGYAFEALMINEFHDRIIPCTHYVPYGLGYGDVSSDEKICATTGAAAGADYVDGDTYLAVNFNYHADHLWRNFAIMIALMIFGCCVYLLATEYISAKKSKGEVLLFGRGRVPDFQPKLDEEANTDDKMDPETPVREQTIPDAPPSIQKQTTIFHWDSVNYDIKIKGKPRKILDEVDGWVIPGTLTALMGVTGAGKTTLLDVLANRLTMGIVSGQMLVDGRPRDTGFQRKTGYVQQQDLHLATSTVREALTFSAILRQPKATPRPEKVAYVGEVIKVLEMEAYADAVIGVPGEGLNVEQRKRLTIGVELAAKPALLLFLDEPTSGLDSQTAWSICALLRKLANNGQAILCTIHQPSAILFQEFDRLLFLAMGGKTLYFGEIGGASKTVTSYFERNGARLCGQDENPAEWILEVTGAAPDSESTQDWPAIWNNSEEHKAVKAELSRMKENLSQHPVSVTDPDALQPFAAPYGTQLWIVLIRVFQQYWRTPSYLYSKVALCLFSALFIGFSFWKTPNSLQGLQDQLFAIFLLLTIFSNFCQQIMPHFVTQRALYEVRERPSKTYSWQVFILSNILVEIPWNALMAIIVFVSWYYPIGLRQNAVEADQVAERGALMFLFILAFMIFAGTFTNMVIAGIETAEAAGNITNLLFSLSLIFCGVLATPTALPGFWIFMYRVSPFTYLVSGMLSTGLANAYITCSTEELLHFSPPPNTTCSTYLSSYIQDLGGYLTPESMASVSE